MRNVVDALLVAICAISPIFVTAGCTIGDDVSFGDGGSFDSGTLDSGLPPRDAGDADAMLDGDVSSDADAPDGGSRYGPSDVPRLRARAICDALVACQGEALLTEQLMGADCRERTRRAFEAGPLQYLEGSVQAGRVVFRSEALERCLADIAAQGCSVQRSRRPESCETALEGTVPLGEDCSLDEDCEGLAHCDGGSEGGECPGTCTALLGPTEACSHSDQCQDGFLCAGGECLAPLQGGETCPDPLGTAAPCRRGFECVAISEDESVCRSIEALRGQSLDEACAPPDMLCEPGLSCVNLGETPTCAMPVGKDEPCGRAIPNQCPVHQYCDAETGEMGSCVDLPVDGEPCLGRAGLDCAPMHVCEADDTCHRIGMEGDDCVGDRGCFSRICEGADSGTGSCAAPAVCEP